jgi:hypothetical protein
MSAWRPCELHRQQQPWRPVIQGHQIVCGNWSSKYVQILRKYICCVKQQYGSHESLHLTSGLTAVAEERFAPGMWDREHSSRFCKEQLCGRPHCLFMWYLGMLRFRTCLFLFPTEFRPSSCLVAASDTRAAAAGCAVCSRSHETVVRMCILLLQKGSWQT